MHIFSKYDISWHSLLTLLVSLPTPLAGVAYLLQWLAYPTSQCTLHTIIIMCRITYSKKNILLKFITTLVIS